MTHQTLSLEKHWKLFLATLSIINMLLFSSAGSLVNKMGVPVELICAVNVNDIVHRMISTGDFSISQDVKQTWSSAMDIQVHTSKTGSSFYTLAKTGKFKFEVKSDHRSRFSN